jgi:hypothetical protein
MRHRREVVKLNFYSSDPNIFIAFSPSSSSSVAELAPINKSMIAKRIFNLSQERKLFFASDIDLSESQKVV